MRSPTPVIDLVGVPNLHDVRTRLSLLKTWAEASDLLPCFKDCWEEAAQTENSCILRVRSDPSGGPFPTASWLAFFSSTQGFHISGSVKHAAERSTRGGRRLFMRPVTGREAGSPHHSEPPF